MLYCGAITSGMRLRQVGQPFRLGTLETVQMDLGEQTLPAVTSPLSRYAARWALQCSALRL